MDVQQRPEHVTPTIAHEIVNGDHTQNGQSATSHAMEDPRTEPEYCNNLLLTEEWIALDNQPNSGIAICMDAPLTANGALGPNGTCAQEAVEVECKGEPGQSRFPNGTAENDA